LYPKITPVICIDCNEKQKESKVSYYLLYASDKIALVSASKCGMLGKGVEKANAREILIDET